MKVKTTLQAEVPDPIAAQIIEDFLEWADDEGFELVGAIGDERSYDQLANDYVVSVVDG